MADSAKIFVVDDEPLMAETVARGITQAGFSVETATDSAEALKRIGPRIRGYEVVITDNNMPGISGTELVKELRKAGFAGKVIMFSGNVSFQEERQIRA